MSEPPEMKRYRVLAAWLISTLVSLVQGPVNAQEISVDEILVFWACGVTPQNAIRMAKPEICITHTPGSMLITDLPSQLDSRLGD